MNIEFIKWMCEKAEGFKYKGVSKYGDLVKVVKLGADGLWFDPVEVGSWNYKYLFYPLLLQRAIEGLSDNYGITVERAVGGWQWCENSIKPWGTTDLDFFDTPDQAKEAALKLVWENEK